MNGTRGETVLVTGATGMVGRAVVPRLVEEGWNVRAGIRSVDPPAGWAPLPVEIVRGDLASTEHLRRLTSPPPKAVVHLAARVHVRGGDAEFFRQNTEVTRELAERSLASGCSRFVFLSTVAVHPPNEERLSEETPVAPETAYGESKLEAERVLREMEEESALSVTVLRPSVIYGPHDRGNVLRLIRAVDRGLDVRIGGRRTRKSMTYVDNVASVIALCLSDGASAGSTYLVSDPEPYEMDEIVDRIAASLGRRRRTLEVPRWLARLGASAVEASCRSIGGTPPITRRDVQVMGRDVICDVDRLRSELGYESEVRLEEGLRRTVRWYREQKSRGRRGK